MAAAHFFMRGGKSFSLGYFHHGTPLADKMMQHVTSWGERNKIPVLTGRIGGFKPSKCSPEEFWRNERYGWLNGLGSPIVTCHHLNDAVETWVFSSLHGNPKLIQSNVGNVYRPLLLNTKQQLVEWCVRNDVSWVEDESNRDTRYPRNRIRHNIIPECMMVNPGLEKVIKKKILSRDC